MSASLEPAIIEFSDPLPSSLDAAARTSASDSRRTRADRSSPYRSANTSPCDWPWSDSTTKWYLRGATSATASSWASTASIPSSAASDSGWEIPAWWATAS